MPSVTVEGAGGQTVTLSYESSANALIASALAGKISAGVAQGVITPVSDATTPPGPLPGGIVGEFVKQQNGLTRLAPGYTAVVDNAASAIIIGSGDLGESVLAGAGNLTFEALAGAGTVAAGGGSDEVVIARSDKGAWQINLGNGDDTVVAAGTGADTITVGTGRSTIILGAGSAQVSVGGADTISAGTGAATITGTSGASVVLYAGAGNLDFVGGDGGNTVFAGTGSETLFAGKGSDVLHGGSAGANLLQAGAGNDTLFASTGTAGTDVFQFVKGGAGGADLVAGFTGADKVSLLGYGANEVANAIANQTHSAGSTTIVLSDNTSITFQNVANLTKSNFS